MAAAPVLAGEMAGEAVAAPAKAKKVELKGDRPFEHPFYWAAFTLLGDPD